MMLSDCVARTGELFIVPSGSMREIAGNGRDRITQAVLDVSSKPIDAEVPLDELLDDDDVKSIIASLNCGIDLAHDPEWGIDFEMSHLRYHKIILSFDEDARGLAIKEGVIGLFHRLFSPIVRAGYLYEATADKLHSMSEEDFVREVMDPKTRKIVRIDPAAQSGR